MLYEVITELEKSCRECIGQQIDITKNEGAPGLIYEGDSVIGKYIFRVAFYVTPGSYNFV